MKTSQIFFIIIIVSGTLIFSGCRKISAPQNFSPTIKERSLYEEYMEQFEIIYNKVKTQPKKTPANLEDIKNEISTINKMDLELRKKLAKKYRLNLKEIDQVIFKVLDDKLKEKGWEK